LKLFYKIVIGDSKDMSEVADRSVNLTVTSPPYLDLVEFEDSVKGELSVIKKRDTLFEVERKFFSSIKVNFEEVYRVTKPGGIFVLEFEDYPVGSKFYGYPREILLAGKFAEAVESTGFYLISRWFWKKFQAGSALQKFRYLTYGNLKVSDPRAVVNIAYCFVFKKFTKFNEKRKLDFTVAEWREWSDGIWYIENPVTELEAGEAVFPVELARRFIKMYTNKGDVVLDPFLGTGTTMKAACELERSCIGYEIRPRMLPKIKAKVKYGQFSLFDEVNWEVIEK
jgi:DNA modification methylase